MSSEISIKDQGLQPWQFFVLAALGCTIAVTFVVRGRGLTPLVVLAVLMGTAAFVGAAVLWAIQPLVSPEDDRTVMIGERTRVALEREKYLVLKSIKELEFDRAMGKLSETDWHDMSGTLRTRAARLMRELDAGSGYREQIEKDLTRRLGVSSGSPSGQRTGSPACSKCATANDHDATFCKRCGAPL